MTRDTPKCVDTECYSASFGLTISNSLPHRSISKDTCRNAESEYNYHLYLIYGPTDSWSSKIAKSVKQDFCLGRTPCTL